CGVISKGRATKVTSRPRRIDVDVSAPHLLEMLSFAADVARANKSTDAKTSAVRISSCDSGHTASATIVSALFSSGVILPARLIYIKNFEDAIDQRRHELRQWVPPPTPGPLARR